MCLTNYHAMKRIRGAEVQLHVFLISPLNGAAGVSFTPQPLWPPVPIE